MSKHLHAGKLGGVSELGEVEVPIAQAATVLMLRDAGPGFEVLLVRRAQQLVFHGGAWVFPGGRVDGAELDAGDGLGAARRAAVREVREETGLVLEPQALLPFAHWTTPRGRPRRFATWYFAAAVQSDQDRIVVDGGEICEYRWLTPAAALAAQAAGEIELPPPTFVTLSEVGESSSVAAVLDAFRAAPPRVYVPRLARTPLGEVALYEGDVAYGGGDADQPGRRHRLLMCAGAWRYDRGV